MKKIVLLSISIFVLTAFAVKAQNPIPSYNVPIYKSLDFAEPITIGAQIQLDEKRDVCVENGPSNNKPILSAPILTVYVYRLDYSVVLGPFTVNYGEKITVNIDDQTWGVYAESTGPSFMSVYTNF